MDRGWTGGLGFSSCGDLNGPFYILPWMEVPCGGGAANGRKIRDRNRSKGGMFPPCTRSHGPLTRNLQNLPKTVASSMLYGMGSRVINLIRSKERDLRSIDSFLPGKLTSDARLGTGFCPLAKYLTIPMSSHNQSDTFWAQVWFKNFVEENFFAQRASRGTT